MSISLPKLRLQRSAPPFSASFGLANVREARQPNDCGHAAEVSVHELDERQDRPEDPVAQARAKPDPATVGVVHAHSPDSATLSRPSAHRLTTGHAAPMRHIQQSLLEGQYLDQRASIQQMMRHTQIGQLASQHYSRGEGNLLDQLLNQSQLPVSGKQGRHRTRSAFSAGSMSGRPPHRRGSAMGSRRTRSFAVAIARSKAGRDPGQMPSLQVGYGHEATATPTDEELQRMQALGHALSEVNIVADERC